MVHTSLSLCQHLTTWKAALTNQRILARWSKITAGMMWTHAAAHHMVQQILEIEKVAQCHHASAQTAINETLTAIQYGLNSPTIFVYAEHMLPQLLAEIQSFQIDPAIACMMASQKARWGSPWVFSPTHPCHPNQCSLNLAIQQHNIYMAAYDERTAYNQAWHLLGAIGRSASFDHQVQNLRDVLQEKISANDPFLQLEIEANQIMMQSALDFLKEAVAQPHRSLSHSTVAGLTGDIMYFMLLNEIAQAQSSNTSVATPQRLETVSRTLTASDPTPAGESPAAYLPRRTVSDMRHTDRTVPDEWLATVPSFPPASHQSTPKLANVQIQSGQESESTLAPDHYHWHNGNRKEDKMAQDYLESLQHQFIQAANAANKLNNARAMMETNCAIRRWTTAMLNSHSISKELQQTSSEPHQKA